MECSEKNFRKFLVGVGKGFAEPGMMAGKSTTCETFPDPVGAGALSAPSSWTEPLPGFGTYPQLQPDGVRRGFANDLFSGISVGDAKPLPTPTSVFAVGLQAEFAFQFRVSFRSVLPIPLLQREFRA